MAMTRGKIRPFTEEAVMNSHDSGCKRWTSDGIGLVVGQQVVA